MSIRRRLCVPFWAALLVTGSVAAQSGSRQGYNEAFIGPPLADAVMQYNKESYVTYGCAYCHGVNLVPRGEAPDLRTSALVGNDVDGSIIVAALRAGFPQTTKLSPMPQYSDLSDQQLHAIAAYVHYARQRVRYAELTQGLVTGGDARAGRTDFEQRCSTCHAPGKDLAGLGKTHDAAALRARILEPPALAGGTSFAVDKLHDTRTAMARLRHGRLLENYSVDQVANLVAYLQDLN